METRQTRIYAPNHEPYTGKLWAETMMARIIRPLVSHPGVSWVWVTRYASETPEFDDSDGSKAPADFFNGHLCRSLRFRFLVEPEHRTAFEESGTVLVNKEACWLADWRKFPVDSLAGDRFLGSPRTPDRKMDRLPLVMNFLDSVTRLTLHALVEADQEGRFKIEDNDHRENPHNSAFFSLHHLFCNTTDVILTALINCRPPGLKGGTLQYPPKDLVDNPNQPSREFRVRF